MERLHIETAKLLDPFSNKARFGFLVSMNNTNYEKNEPKVLQTYTLTALNEDGFKQCFFLGYFNDPRKEPILDFIFETLTNPYKNESFEAIYDKIIDEGPNGDIDGKYIDWNDIRQSLIRSKLISEK